MRNNEGYNMTGDSQKRSTGENGEQRYQQFQMDM